jgi:hypothetical protein
MTSALRKLKALWLSLHRIPRVYLTCYILVLFLIVFWIPGNDYDSMTSYIARIKLEEFGPLRETATLEIQYLFPKFFDYLHAPLLKWGYFTTLPSFLLFLLVPCLGLLCLARFPQYLFLAFILTAQPILLAAASLKNDLAVGAFAFAAWWWIATQRRSAAYLPVSLLLFCALAGTKWQGAFAILPLSVFLLIRLCKTHRPSMLSLLLCVLCLPVFYLVSSADVYLANILYSQTPTPTPAWLAGQTHGLSELPVNLARFLVATVEDTFDLPFYFIDINSGWHIWPWLTYLSFGGKFYDYTVLTNSQHMSIFGLPLIVVMACSIFILLQRHQPLSVYAAAGTCLVYTLLILIFVRYDTWINRYFIPSFLLGLIPTCRLLGKSKWRVPILWILMIFGLINSLQTLFLDEERLLVPFTQRFADGHFYENDPIYSRLLDRDNLYFEDWSGYWSIYQFFKSEVHVSDSLLFLNKATGGDVPFIYPFLRDREASNTRIINERYGKTWNHAFTDQFEYVMVYRGSLPDPSYDEIYSYPGGNDINIYRRHSLNPGSPTK